MTIVSDYEELEEYEKVKDKFCQWINDGESYAVPDRDGLTLDERLANMDISREMELLKKLDLDDKHEGDE